MVIEISVGKTFFQIDNMPNLSFGVPSYFDAIQVSIGHHRVEHMSHAHHIKTLNSWNPSPLMPYTASGITLGPGQKL